MDSDGGERDGSEWKVIGRMADSTVDKGRDGKIWTERR